MEALQAPGLDQGERHRLIQDALLDLSAAPDHQHRAAGGFAVVLVAYLDSALKIDAPSDTRTLYQHPDGQGEMTYNANTLTLITRNRDECTTSTASIGPEGLVALGKDLIMLGYELQGESCAAVELIDGDFSELVDKLEKLVDADQATAP